MSRNFFIVLCLAFTAVVTWAGEVKGIVTDSHDGEVLIGATIIAEDGHGVVSDIDGRYVISLTNGKHTLTVRYMGYQPLSKEVFVSASESGLTLDFALMQNENVLQSATVVGVLQRNTEASSIKEQQEAHTTMTGVSEQQIKKTQDKNAGEVIRRIPGVSIIDEKFVMVRGLSQRYNNVWLNGAAVPSSEADQRAFSFDVVPSSQLDNLKVVKSSAPEYPADFSGGFIMVNTKDVPSSNTWSVGINGSVNSETHMRTMLGCKDNGDAFSGISVNWRTRSRKPVADFGVAADVAHRWLTEGGHTWGLTGSINYTNGFQTLRDMKNNMFGAFDVTHDRSNYLRRTTDQQYNNNTRLGAMLGLVWLPAGGQHRVEVKQILNRLTKDRYTYRRGYDAQSDYLEQAEYYYQSRLTYNLGFSGKHTLGNDDKLNWNLGYAYANRDFPDRKRYTLYEQESGTLEIENLNDINRELSHLDEHIMSGSANWQHKFAFESWQPSLMAGGYAEYRGRDYSTQFFTYAWPTGQLPQSMRALDVTTELLDDGNYGNGGLYLIEQVDWSNNYEANGRLACGYLSMHLPVPTGWFEAYGGLRFEHSQTELVSHTRRQCPSPFSTFYTYNDLFPSVNFIFHVNKEHQLRLAYGRTTNRPEFRELSTSVYYDFDLASNVQGNHNLKPAYINNIDMGWEWYPHAGEVVSLSLFYKQFKSPIEWTYTVAGGTDLVYSYLNADGANNYGIEVDVRKQLDFIHLPQLSVSLNASVIKSRVEFPAGCKEANRPMQGQSPYLVNAGLFWNSDQAETSLKGWTSALLYNIIGKRLIGVGRSVGSGATEVRVPDSYEMPRHQMDFNLSKQLGGFNIRLSVRDVIAQKVVYKQFEETPEREIEQVTRCYRPGRTFSIGITYKIR